MRRHSKFRTTSLGWMIGAAALCAPGLQAGEVHLKDGRVLVGPTRVEAEIVRVETEDGWVRVPIGDVVRIRDDAELRGELSRLAEHGTAPHQLLELARLAHRWGLDEEMWGYLGSCVENTPRQGRKRERLDEFMSGLEADFLPKNVRAKEPKARVRSLLYKVRPGLSAAREAAITAILSDMEGAEDALRERARQAGTQLQRLCALRAISMREDPGGDRFLYRTGILDRSAEVRARAMTIVGQSGQAPDAIRYLAAGLVHGSPEVRIRTADAFANLNDQSGVAVLVNAGPLAASLPGGSTRAHVAFITQEAYIRDFDVEVAQAAFIADPKVSVIQSGTVFDATVHAVTTERVLVVKAYRRALKHLTGSDPGGRTSSWAEWYADLNRPAGAAANGIPGDPSPSVIPSAATGVPNPLGLRNPGDCRITTPADLLRRPPMVPKARPVPQGRPTPTARPPAPRPVPAGIPGPARRR